MRKVRQPNTAGFISETAPAATAPVVSEEPKKRGRKKAEEAEAVVEATPTEPTVDAVEPVAEVSATEATDEKPAETESL